MNNWISVKDRLPPCNKVLLLWRPIDHADREFHKEIIVGEMAHESNDTVWANGMYYEMSTHITHWMPLPELPKNA